MAFRITSPAFADGADIPLRHTCDGDNLSPRLTWTDVPEGTRGRSFMAFSVWKSITRTRRKRRAATEAGG